MRPTISIALVATSLAACTVQQEGATHKQEFHPPLTYATWNTERYSSQEGKPVCVVTSGYGGLSVQLRHDTDDKMLVAVRVNRPLPPGTLFSVNVNGHHYETSKEFFPASDSAKITEDLIAGGKAYLEWSEPDYHGRLRTGNILKLDGFKPELEGCERKLRS